jgi:hypothetical protein
MKTVNNKVEHTLGEWAVSCSMKIFQEITIIEKDGNGKLWQ